MNPEPEHLGSPPVREIAALTARLRALSAADPDEVAAFLADKDALLIRIADSGEPFTNRGAPDAG